MSRVFVLSQLYFLIFLTSLVLCSWRYYDVNIDDDKCDGTFIMMRAPVAKQQALLNDINIDDNLFQWYPLSRRVYDMNCMW